MKKIENDTIKFQLIEKIVSQKFNNLDEYDNVINLNDLLEDDTDIYYATYYEAEDPTDENSDGKRKLNHIISHVELDAYCDVMSNKN